MGRTDACEQRNARTRFPLGGPVLRKHKVDRLQNLGGARQADTAPKLPESQIL